MSGTAQRPVLPASVPSAVRQSSPSSRSSPTSHGRRPPLARTRGLPLAIGLQAANSAGDGLAMVILGNRVFQSTHAPWAVAAVFLAVCLPISALAPVAGLMLDRLPPKPVLAISAGVQALISLALVWASGLAATLMLSAGFGLCAALLQPGLGAIVPRLASRTSVTKANSYLQAATWGGFTAGPLLAGVLLLAAGGGSGLALTATAAMYAAAAAGLAVLRLTPRDRAAAAAAAHSSLGSQLRAGVVYLRSDTAAGMLVLIVGLMTACANMAVVAEVVFAEQVLHAGPTGYSLLVAGWTGGMVIGTLAGGRLRPRWLATAALTGTVLTGAGVALAGTAAVLWQAVTAYALGGLANGLETVATRSFLSKRAPEAVAGRVFAIYSGVIFGGVSAGMAAAAGLMTVFGARGVLFIAGLGGVAAGAAGCGWFATRAMAARRAARELERFVAPERGCEPTGGTPPQPATRHELDRVARHVPQLPDEPELTSCSADM